MSEWQKVTIEQIHANTNHAMATGPFGSAISSKFFTDNGVPVIRGGNLSADVSVRLSEEGLVYVSPSKAKEFQRSIVREGDLVFTCWGTINQIGLIDGKGTYQEYIISNKQMKLTPDPLKADSRFLYYLFSSPQMQEWILRSNIGSSVPGFNLGQLKATEIDLPPLSEQKAITAVLASLDDKIDLLHRQNKTLESLAQTFFRHWFIDEAEEFVPLTELVEINPKLSIKKGTVAPYLEMKNVQTDSCAPLDWFDREYKSGTRFQNGDTLMARITPCLENNKVSFVDFLDGNEVGWGSTEFLVLRARGDLPKFYTYTLAKDSDFRAFAIKSMTGSSGRQRVQTKSLYNYELGIPSQQNLKLFTDQIKVFEQRLRINTTQIRTLEQLRDTLLPKLMSGEIRVAI